MRTNQHSLRPILTQLTYSHVAAVADLTVSPPRMEIFVNGAQIPATPTGGVPTSIQDSPTPVRIGPDSDWTSISATRYGCVGLKRDGSLWAWGLDF